MEFVKYVISCFKVYYPKFLCKSTEPLSKRESPRCRLAVTGRLPFLCPFSQNDYRGYALDHEW